MQAPPGGTARKTRQFSTRPSTVPGPRPTTTLPAMRAPPRPASRNAPQVPEPLPIARALGSHEALARLGRLIRESNRRMEIVAPCLPGALIRFVRPGPVDEEAWTLLAANAAVAAKLRHMQPRLEELLAEQGLQPTRVRVKVQKQS